MLQAMTKFDEKVYQSVNDVMAIPSALRDIELNFWRQGYDVQQVEGGSAARRQ